MVMLMTMRLGARELGVSDDLIACCFEFEDYCGSLENRFDDNDDDDDDGDDDDGDDDDFHRSVARPLLKCCSPIPLYSRSALLSPLSPSSLLSSSSLSPSSLLSSSPPSPSSLLSSSPSSPPWLVSNLCYLMNRF